MKRVWKPLDVNGLRLYEVRVRFIRHPEWDQSSIVAASSPNQAASLIEQTDERTIWMDDEKPTYEGYALDIYQPKEWTE